LTLSGGTANGVLYLNGSKVATSGSGLSFDGTTLANINSDGTGFSTQSAASNFSIMRFGTDSVNGYAFFQSGKSGTGTTLPFAWRQDSSELMRLTSTGLGIGTSSPAYKLDVAGAINSSADVISQGNDARISLYRSAGINYFDWASGQSLYFSTQTSAGGAGRSTKMVLTDGGNLGIGTSSPTHKLQTNGSGRFGTMTTGPGLLSGSSDTFQVGLNQDNTNTTNTQVWAEYVNGATSASWAVRYRAANDTGTASTRLFLDAASGNLGLGVTPSAWVEGTGLNVGGGRGGSIFTETVNYGFTTFNANAYYSATNTWKYVTSNAASRYQQLNGIHSWYTAPSGTAGNAISFTQAMTLNADGELLIGTTSDAGAFKLQVNGDALVVGGNALCLRGASSYISSPATDVINFATASTERARITSDGKLLLNTTSTLGGSAAYLQVDTSANAAIFKGSSSNQDILNLWNSATSGDNIFLLVGTEGTFTTRGSIDYNRAGGLTRYNTTSDYRAKDVYGLLENTGSVIDALKVYNGKMKGATQERPMLIAHEAQEVAPYAVSGVKDEENEDGTPKYQQMDHSSLVPLLIAEIQSLRARVAQLESK